MPLISRVWVAYNGATATAHKQIDGAGVTTRKRGRRQHIMAELSVPVTFILGNML